MQVEVDGAANNFSSLEHDLDDLILTKDQPFLREAMTLPLMTG